MSKYLKLFGDNPRNRIIEWFLCMRELEYSGAELSEFCKMHKATVYLHINPLLKKKWLLKRRVANGSLFSLNRSNKDIQLLIKIFDLILSEVEK